MDFNRFPRTVNILQTLLAYMLSPRARYAGAIVEMEGARVYRGVIIVTTVARRRRRRQCVWVRWRVRVCKSSPT